MQIGADSIERDLPVMVGLTLVLFVMGWGFRGRLGRINRWEAGALLAAYVAYTGWLLNTIAPAA
jgi:cation:H+ antiporter